MEGTTCDNMSILKNNCKYLNEKGINEIFDPKNMGIGTTFMEIGPKLTNLYYCYGYFGQSQKEGVQGISYYSGKK